MSDTNTYPIAAQILFWLLWLIGLQVFLLFGFMSLLVMESPLAGIWNFLVAATEAYLLYNAFRHFRRKSKTTSQLLLQATVIAIGIPLLATGGCITINELGHGIRIAG